VRREHDFYPTQAWATRELLARVNVRGRLIEPCVGRGDISTLLAADTRVTQVYTNDVDRARAAHEHSDATDPAWWARLSQVDWVVTNPPFVVAHKIVPLAFQHARLGAAMLLRLTYLEPCEGRAEWLQATPPTRWIVLPRISFTGDGKTDSVTCAWFVWDRQQCGQSLEIVAPGDRRQASILDLAAHA
jgi:hypothetical protein